MENKEDTIRVKEEPKYTWPDAADDYVLDSVNSCKVENFEILPFHESSANHQNQDIALQKKLDEKIFIDLECKYVKPEVPFRLARICKTDPQGHQPIH